MLVDCRPTLSKSNVLLTQILVYKLSEIFYDRNHHYYQLTEEIHYVIVGVYIHDEVRKLLD